MSIPEQIYLIGGDVKHSLSPIIHENIYKYLGLPIKYKALSLSSNKDVEKFLKDHSNDEFFASNVTYPYKALVYNYFDKKHSNISEKVKFSGGCNLIIWPELSFYNYDGLGFIKFVENKGIVLEGKNIVMCGTGITAMSIANEITKKNICSLTILSRSKDKVFKLNKNFVLDASVKQLFSTYDDAKIASADIIINAAPGNFIELLSQKINLNDLNPRLAMIDLNYCNDYAKEFTDNFIFYDGKYMLVAQAVYCVQEICRKLNFINKKVNDFDKLYNIGIDSIM